MRELLLTTRKFSVERICIDGAGGHARFLERVVHPGAVVILPLLDDGRIVMIRNFRPTVGGVLLELPAGTREPGEELLVTAGRELEEETGYRAGQIEALIDFYPSPGVLTERMWAFSATILHPTAQRLDPGERIAVEIMDPKELRRMLLGGEIHDGKTIAVLGTYFLGQLKER